MANWVELKVAHWCPGCHQDLRAVGYSDMVRSREQLDDRIARECATCGGTSVVGKSMFVDRESLLSAVAAAKRITSHE